MSTPIRPYGVKLSKIPDGQHFIARIAKNSECDPFNYFEATINSESDTCACCPHGQWYRIRPATQFDYDTQKVAAKTWGEHWTAHLIIAA